MLIHRPRPCLRAVFIFASLILTGCGTELVLPQADELRSTLDLSAVGLSDASAVNELDTGDGNGLFDSAEPATLGTEALLIHGRIDGAEDIDVYDLGPIEAGERLLVTLSADSTLRGVLAVFDDTETTLLVNDHRNVYLGRTAPFIDIVATRDSPSCFIAITSTPGYISSGDYTLAAGREPAAAIPEPRDDVILLVFSGGTSVRIGGRAAIDVPAFDASTISPDYAGQTDGMVEEIVAAVREDYAAYDVSILSTSEGAVFDTDMTRIYFGTFDPALLGVAEGVDEFNATREQEAVVFTDTFAAFMQLNPTVVRMGQGIANVASHEIGHLMGMIHTNDPEGIMDVTASLNQLLRDQALTFSPIYQNVFPLGFQDAPRYLLDVLGGDPAIVTAQKLRSRGKVREDEVVGALPARFYLKLSGCGLE